MEATTNSSFWTRTPADRNAARRDIMEAGAGFGDSQLGGIVVPILTGTDESVLVAAAGHGLTEVTRYHTTNKGRTILMIELA